MADVVECGDTITLAVAVIDGSSDPSDSADVALSIKSTAGVDLTGFPTSTVDHGVTGAYSYDFACPAGQAVARYEVVWYGTADSDDTPFAIVSSLDVVRAPTALCYADLALFKEYVSDTDAANDELEELALTAASRSIDRACNRTFTVPTAASVRYYTRAPWRYEYHSYHRASLAVDDFMDDTGLMVEVDRDNDGTYEEAITDFVLLPRNAAADGKPWTHIVFGIGVSLPVWEGAIKITAPWGWTAIPSTIVNATLLQASRFWHRKDSPYGVAGSPDLGNEMRLLARLDPDVALLVGDYRRWWGAV